MSPIDDFLQYVDDNQSGFIDRLRDAVAIKSVSGDASLRPDVQNMVDWFDGQLRSYGVQTEQVDLGYQTVDGQQLKLPNAILGRIGDDPNKKTVLVYGHMDVQPAEKSDGWNTDPFTLTIDDQDRMFGRGSTDDKGPICAWVNVLEAHSAKQLDLPVNLRFCFEAMEESGSEGLDDLINKEAAKGEDGYFDNVDCVCISDNYWLNARTPIVTYGLRGVAYFEVTIGGPAQDLHSGMWGNVVHEPMTDLFNIMSQLVRGDGYILVEGVYSGIDDPTPEELALYNALDYTMDDFKSAVGGDIGLSEDVSQLLMGRMRWPSLSLHGIRGASSDETSKTVIPATVTGKFSLRLVPPQTPEDIEKKVKTYIEKVFNTLNTKSTLKEVVMTSGGMPWITDDKNWSYKAADDATMDVYGQNPDHCREGGSIPVTLTFSDALKVPVLLLPVGRGDDGAHSTNEKLDISNYMGGTKLLGTYLYKVAASETGEARRAPNKQKLPARALP
ncbi:CNDP dipeptidase [Cristinia sonorae]|uniref:CNDP dipeptidase n=1 Tax=Cristinia sonorae TaxID=1940300 RepID=A0A8K0XL68_9AGAR|nr:CNDP dipeptidase [Cristinia sonorae]